MDRLHRTTRRRFLTLSAAITLAGCAGCETQYSTHGVTRIVAAYDTWDGDLTASFPGRLSVPQVHAAATAALRSRGYVLVEDRSTEGEGYIKAGQHRQGIGKHWDRSIILRSRDAGDQIVVTIGASPRPDQAECRNVLDEMLSLLGL